MSTNSNEQTLNLISNITHQAINPLNGVIGTLDNIIDGTTSGARIDQRLRSARAQLEYTVSLIRNLAYFALYSTNTSTDPRFKATKISVIPQTLIEAAMFFQEQGSNDHITFSVMERELQTAVKGDPDLLRQVFMNLFDNFVKYGIQESTVEVRHWIQKSTGDLLITFSGQSTPFSPEEDIFALGVRGTKAMEKTSAGSGLGLHICRLIIGNLFNGTITAQFIKASQTANFEIRIPGGFINER